MTNDAKLWGWRIVVFIMFSIDGSILTKAITGGGAKQAISPLWFIIFFVACVLNIPVYVMYRRAKAGRWGNSNKTPEQLQVEILAAAAKNGAVPPMAKLAETGTPKAQNTGQPTPQQPTAQPPKQSPPQDTLNN
jgi:hypothetical protein